MSKAHRRHAEAAITCNTDSAGFWVSGEPSTDVPTSFPIASQLERDVAPLAGNVTCLRVTTDGEAVRSSKGRMGAPSPFREQLRAARRYY